MDKNNDKNYYYFLMFIVIIGVFALFEAAIVESDFIPTLSSKFFWSGMNFITFIGLPVFIFCVNKLSK